MTKQSQTFKLQDFITINCIWDVKLVTTVCYAMVLWDVCIQVCDTYRNGPGLWGSTLVETLIASGVNREHHTCVCVQERIEHVVGDGGKVYCVK